MTNAKPNPRADLIPGRIKVLVRSIDRLTNGIDDEAKQRILSAIVADLSRRLKPAGATTPVRPTDPHGTEVTLAESGYYRVEQPASDFTFRAGEVFAVVGWIGDTARCLSSDAKTVLVPKAKLRRVTEVTEPQTQAQPGEA